MTLFLNYLLFRIYPTDFFKDQIIQCLFRGYQKNNNNGKTGINSLFAPYLITDIIYC